MEFKRNFCVTKKKPNWISKGQIIHAHSGSHCFGAYKSLHALQGTQGYCLDFLHADSAVFYEFKSNHWRTRQRWRACYDSLILWIFGENSLRFWGFIASNVENICLSRLLKAKKYCNFSLILLGGTFIVLVFSMDFRVSVQCLFLSYIYIY